MSRDDATLIDILLAGRRIMQFTRGIDRVAFLGDLEKQSAVLHQFLVLGEAVRRLSPELQRQHAAIPWAKISAMRNMLIHAYDRVDLDIVWHTIEGELPELLISVASLIPADES